MDQLGSYEWRRAHNLGRPVAAELVYDKFQQYIEALEVTGHPRLAEALQERVTRDLCERFPEILFILKSVAKKPGYKVPDLPREPTWEEILADEPMEGEHWEEPNWTDDSMDDDDEETPQMAQTSPELSPELSIEHKPHGRVTAVTVPQFDLQLPELPHELDQPQLVQELRNCVLGYSCWSPRCTTLLDSSYVLLRAEFQHLAKVMAGLRHLGDHAEAGSCFLEVFLDLQTQILALGAPTLLAALGTLKRLLLPWRFVLGLSNNYNTMLEEMRDHALFENCAVPLKQHLELLFNKGRLGPIFSVYEPTTEQMFDDDLDIELPLFFNRQTCIDAGRYAYFCQLLGLTIPPCKIEVLGETINFQIAEIATARLKQLLDHIRPTLLEDWDRISRVYFAHDSRIIEFLHDWSYNGSASALVNLYSAWPDRQFEFVGKSPMTPQFELVPLSRLVLPVDQLKEYWCTLLEAASAATSESQRMLEMQVWSDAAARAVRRRIEGLDALVKLDLYCK